MGDISRRLHERKPVNIPGRLLHNGVTTVCHVVEASPTGFGVEVEPAVPISRLCRFRFGAETYRVEVVWRSGERVGLHITESENAKPVAPVQGVQPTPRLTLDELKRLAGLR